MSAPGTSRLVIDDTSSTYLPIPGLSGPVNVSAGSTLRLLIEADGGIQVNSGQSDDECIVDIGIFVDGAQTGAERRVIALNGPSLGYAVGSFGLSTAATVGAGAHTVAVMAKRFGSTVGECYVSSGPNGSGLPGNPRLQATVNVLGMQ